MIDAVVGVGYFVVVDVREGGRRDRNERVWIFGKDGKDLVGIGDVGVVDAFREVHDYEFSGRVSDIDAIGDTVLIDRDAIVSDGGDGGSWGYWTQDEGGGDGRIGARVVDGVGDGGEGIHDVLRGAVEFVACDFEGHILVAGRLGRRMVGVTMYLYSVDDD